MFNANINTNGSIRFWQNLIIKFTQARHKISSCTVFSDCDGTWLAWQMPRPTNIKRLFAFGNKKLTVCVFKSTFGKFSRLLVSFLFECWVFSTTLKEVFKGGLLVSKYLLGGNTRNIIQKSKLRLFFKPSQSGIGLNIANFSFALVVFISTPTQNRVIDKSHTAKGLSKQFGLFISWVKAKFVGTMFHISHFIIKNVKYQFNNTA
jgi:hypothetical protein